MTDATSGSPVVSKPPPAKRKRTAVSPKVEPEADTYVVDDKFIDIPETMESIIDICRGAAWNVLKELVSGYSTSVWKQAMGVELRLVCTPDLRVARDVQVEVLYRQMCLDSISVDFVISHDGRPVMYLFIQRKASKLTANDMVVMFNVQEQIFKQTSFRPWCMVLHFLPSSLRTAVMYDGRVLDETEKALEQD
jgi:hypothetical protein